MRRNDYRRGFNDGFAVCALATVGFAAAGPAFRRLMNRSARRLKDWNAETNRAIARQIAAELRKEHAR